MTSAERYPRSNPDRRRGTPPVADTTVRNDRKAASRSSAGDTVPIGGRVRPEYRRDAKPSIAGTGPRTTAGRLRELAEVGTTTRSAATSTTTDAEREERQRQRQRRQELLDEELKELDRQIKERQQQRQEARKKPSATKGIDEPVVPAPRIAGPAASTRTATQPKSGTAEVGDRRTGSRVSDAETERSVRQIEPAAPTARDGAQHSHRQHDGGGLHAGRSTTSTPGP